MNLQVQKYKLFIDSPLLFPPIYKILLQNGENQINQGTFEV